MAIKHGSKVQSAINASSMTDLMFLLLIFLLIATTMSTSNALNLTLPRSSNQMTEKAYTTVEITRDMAYAVDGERVPFGRLEEKLREKVGQLPDPLVQVNADEGVDWGKVVEVFNIIRNNRYRLIVGTRPE